MVTIPETVKVFGQEVSTPVLVAAAGMLFVIIVGESSVTILGRLDELQHPRDCSYQGDAARDAMKACTEVRSRRC